MAASTAPYLWRRASQLVSPFQLPPLTRTASCLGQEFVLFLSTEAKQRDLITIVPLDILREIRSLFHLVVSSHTGKLDRHVRPRSSA